MAFTPEQEAALRDILALWGQASVVLIGGAALGALTKMSWRTTRDLDLAVSVESQAATEVLGARPGWRRDPRVGHRWVHRDMTLVDIVPVTPDDMRVGSLRWSPSDAVFNLSGLDLAVAHATELHLRDGTPLRVAPIPVIAILKMASFLDRPHDRYRDLADIGWMLHAYVDGLDDRRFDVRFDALGIEYDESAAYLLGEDLRRIATPGHASLVERFLAAIGSVWLDVFAVRGPDAWRRSPDLAARHLRAFHSGFRGGEP